MLILFEVGEHFEAPENRDKVVIHENLSDVHLYLESFSLVSAFSTILH